MADRLPPKNALARSLKLFNTVTKVGRRELTQRVRQSLQKQWDEKAPEAIQLRVEQAKILSQNLSELKGAAMKVGQLLSVDAADYLPPEALKILSQLQNQAEPVSDHVMMQVLKDELGDKLYKTFQDLSFQSVASASIGQVYRARLKDRDVALKIQYPGISDTVDSDLKILKKIVQPWLALTGKKVDLQESFDEIRIMLSLESDYLHEASCLKKYQKIMEDHKEYRVPDVFTGYCTIKVLCMSWEEGRPLMRWLESKPPSEKRNQIAHWLLDLFILEFFRFGLVQTDPNAGNFLVRENPFQLVLLDFGSTKQYEPAFIESYRHLLSTFRKGKKREIIDAAIENQLLDHRETSEVQADLIEMLQVSLEPFLPEQQPFAFRDPDYAKRSRLSILKFVSNLKYTPPPRQILFLHRKLGGIFNILKALDVQMDLTHYWEKMLQQETAALI